MKFKVDAEASKILTQLVDVYLKSTGLGGLQLANQISQSVTLLDAPAQAPPGVPTDQLEDAIKANPNLRVKKPAPVKEEVTTPDKK